MTHWKTKNVIPIEKGFVNVYKTDDGFVFTDSPAILHQVNENNDERVVFAENASSEGVGIEPACDTYNYVGTKDRDESIEGFKNKIL